MRVQKGEDDREVLLAGEDRAGVADVPCGFGDITFHVDIQSSAPREEIAKLVETVNGHCPVLDILRQPVAVTGSYSHNGIAG